MSFSPQSLQKDITISNNGDVAEQLAIPYLFDLPLNGHLIIHIPKRLDHPTVSSNDRITISCCYREI